MINLDPSYIAILQKILAAHVPDKIIWVYGSRIKGTSHDGSDLDLVIKDPDEYAIPPESLSAVRAALSESNLPILVDILDWSAIPESFQKEIERAHEIFPLS